MDILALKKANKYTDETVNGAGAIKGKNCTIEDITKVDGITTITFKWTLDDGTVQTESMIVEDGIDGIDGEKGDKGDKGVGIESITKQGTNGLVDTYLITFADGTTTTYDVTNGANVTKTSQLENDNEFITNATIGLINYYLKDEVYNKLAIDELLRNVGAGLSVKIVTELPTEDISGTTIYLINTSGSNYNQYMYIDNSWASLGSTAVDLSSYYNKTQIDTMLLGYVDTSTLMTQLMAYAKTADLAKVATSGDYNDLTNLPIIPDVSGIKPYSESLQDSNNTAPTSKVVFDAVQSINESLGNKLEETDLMPYAKSEDVEAVTGDLASLETTEKGSLVGAVNEVNANLGELDSALEDKADKNAVLKSLEIVNGNTTAQIIPWNDGTHYRSYKDGSSNTYTDILLKDGVAKLDRIENNVVTKSEEIATMDKIDSIPLIYNQNTDILAYALTCPQAKRTLVRIHSANATNNPFGVTSDTDFIYEISKIDSADLWISVKAKDVRTNREFINTKNDTKWLGWQELVTMDKYYIPIEANRTITFSDDYTEISVYRCGYSNIRAHIEIDVLCNITSVVGWIQDMGIVLPEGYRPHENISISAWCHSDTESHIPIHLMIGADGKLSGYMGQTHTSINRLNITATYFK